MTQTFQFGTVKNEYMTVKSLFSGAGGLDCGLTQAGLNVVESYEYDRHACDTLANVGASDVYRCDITKLLLHGQLRTMVLTATFPCKYFSCAGTRKYDDELYLDAARFIRNLGPEIFVIENVVGMKKSEVTMEAFMKMPGYYVKDFVLNVADCGGPQNRKRLIIMGSKIPFEWDFTPVPPDKRTRLIDILEAGTTEPLTKGMLNRLNGAHPGQWSAHIKDPMVDDYANTCLAHYAKDRGEQLVIDPVNRSIRPYTTKEYGRLQGFPDDYPFSGGKAATLRQIGNAVSPYMARMIGKEIIRYIRTVNPDLRAYNDIHGTVVKKEVLG